MNEDRLSDRQGIRIIISFIFGSTLIIGSGGAAESDAWLAIIIAILAAIPILMMYSRILSHFPEKGFFEILEETFGKNAGKLIALPFIWFAFHLGALVLRNFGEFIITVALPETPEIVPMLIYVFICIFAIKDGLTTVANCSSFFTYISIFVLVLFGFLSIPNMRPENFEPVAFEGIKPIIEGAFSSITFPFLETIVFLMIFKPINSNKSVRKVFISGLLIGGIFVLFTTSRNIMVLGSEAIGTVYFPSYAAVTRINIGDFLQRLEIAVSIVFLVSGFVKISVCLLAASKGLSRILGFASYKSIVIPVGLLMTTLAVVVYDNIMDMFEWAFYIWPYYAIVFQVILPFLIFIAVEIKARKTENPQGLQNN